MITVKNLTKTFHVAQRKSGTGEAIKSFFRRETKQIVALDQVSFNISKGEIVGYIGPNGAGKSTTIKLLSGILRPDEGTCVVNGRVPWEDRIAHCKRIGVVFGQRSQLWWDIPVQDSFLLLKEIYKVPDQVFDTNLAELTNMLQLEEVLKTPTRQLSLGQRMRCEIVASLLHQPDILFLDEPTIGLDAVSKLAVRKFIQQVNEKFQTTVILTTHDMQDIEKLASRIIMIGKGAVLYDGSLDEFKRFKQTPDDSLDDVLVRLYQSYRI